MSCEAVQPELLGFHFGEVSDPVRLLVEQHLETCPGCLRSYLALKRSVETAEGQPEPSASFHARLRSAVAQELGLGPPRWRWWERPVALGFATAALLVAILTVHAVVTTQVPPRDPSVAGRVEGPRSRE